MGFDYGTKEKIGGIGNCIKLWPTEGSRTALLDADSIAYVVGYTSDLQQYLKMKRDPNWKDSDIWLSKKNHANFLLNKWIDQAQCDSAVLFMTNGPKNFRLKIAKTKPYKGQRVEEKPPFYNEIREWLVDFHKARMSNGCEADDDISIEAWKRIARFEGELWTEEHKKFSEFVVVSGDKDLGIVPTWRCLPSTGVLEWVDPLGKLAPKYKTKDVTAYEYWPLFKGKPVPLSVCNVPMMYAGKMQLKIKGDLKRPANKWELGYVWHKEAVKQDTFIRGSSAGKGKFKRVKVGKKKSEYIDSLKGVGLKFFYAQLIMGDTVDNYDGLPGKGDTFAFKLLDTATSEEELYRRVLDAYTEVHRCPTKAAEMLLEQGQLAWMQTKRGELWQLPKSKSPSFPL